MDAQMRRGLSLVLGLGFGIGLSVASILLGAASGGPGMPPDEEVRQRARKLGMVDMTEMPPRQPVPAVVAKPEVILLIPSGVTWEEAGALLEDAGLLADGGAISALAKERGLEKKPVQPGVYRLNTDLTPDQAVDLLENGPPD